jgi:hypothetical protein
MEKKGLLRKSLTTARTMVKVPFTYFMGITNESKGKLEVLFISIYNIYASHFILKIMLKEPQDFIKTAFCTYIPMFFPFYFFCLIFLNANCY